MERRERGRLGEERLKVNSQSLQSTLLTLGIPAVAIVMLLALVAFVARILLDPLKAVSASARKISAGTFDVSLPPESKDVIGDLVRAFREMITAVQRRQREVTEALERERHQSEISAALRAKAEREHRRLQATIETVPVALVIVDVETGRIALQNRTAGLLIGHEPDDPEAREAYWAAFVTGSWVSAENFSNIIASDIEWHIASSKLRTKVEREIAEMRRSQKGSWPLDPLILPVQSA